MIGNVTLLNPSDIRLLIQASVEIAPGELKALFNESIHRGPNVSLRAELHRIDQRAVPLACWLAFNEFVDWGAGIVYPDNEDGYAFLLADSAHVCRVLKNLRSLLDSDSKQVSNRISMTCKKPIPPAKQQRKRDDVYEPR